MAENVGDIEYVIKADTAQLLRADKQVRDITDGMEGGFIATMGSAAAVGQTAYAESMVAAKGLALAGGRRYGGGVSAGNAYRINEDGRSEIFQTAGGQQMFIPNQSGKVISADKVGGGGGVVQHITFEINTTGGIDDATKAWIVKSMKQVALYQINDQANRPNGMIQPRTKR